MVGCCDSDVSLEFGSSLLVSFCFEPDSEEEPVILNVGLGLMLTGFFEAGAGLEAPASLDVIHTLGDGTTRNFSGPFTVHLLEVDGRFNACTSPSDDAGMMSDSFELLDADVSLWFECDFGPNIPWEPGTRSGASLETHPGSDTPVSLDVHDDFEAGASLELDGGALTVISITEDGGCHVAPATVETFTTLNEPGPDGGPLELGVNSEEPKPDEVWVSGVTWLAACLEPED